MARRFTAQPYNVSDQNKHGFLNETDARLMFPQGHGDAWGHYLTAITPVRLEFAGFPGRTFGVQFATGLPSRKWTTLGSATARANGRFEFIDLTAPGQPVRFYRALEP